MAYDYLRANWDGSRDHLRYISRYFLCVCVCVLVCVCVCVCVVKFESIFQHIVTVQSFDAISQ